jgi:L-2-hydroxyglutarate oxidase
MTSLRASSVAVVGGGIVGLAVARELCLRYPGLQVTLLEKEQQVAAHQSGHNSGVIHAGLYYQPGSLKAELCRRGGAMLREFCQQHKVPYKEIGKLVVAVSAAELGQLEELEARAHANRVPGLRRVSGPGLREIEPHVTGVAALHSPHTAVVDYTAVCLALARDVSRHGGNVLLGTVVRALSQQPGGVTVGWSGGSAAFDYVIACAGLQGDRLAAGSGADVRILPFRGEFYDLRPHARERVRGMIYPVPDPRYPFLGVHLTRNLSGAVRVGPNAVLAMAMEAYRRRDVSLPDLWQMASWPGAWRLARAHWRTGARELGTSLSKRLYLAQVRRYLPELGLADMSRSPAGVRAQAVDRQGRLVDDFVIDRRDRLVLVRNAPSPAATSSLAIAEHVVSALED